MSIALHGWHRLHTGWNLWHGHGFILWGAASAALVLGALLLWRTDSERRDAVIRTPVSAPASSISPGMLERICARALTQAEAAFAADPTPDHRLCVARCVWRLACALPPDQTEHYQALLDRAARLLDDPRLAEHLTPDDRLVKATIGVLRAPLLDLPRTAASGAV